MSPRPGLSPLLQLHMPDKGGICLAPSRRKQGSVTRLLVGISAKNPLILDKLLEGGDDKGGGLRELLASPSA